VLKGVLRNYARFYAKKAFLSYPWQKDPFKRKYLRGCLRAFARTTINKKFYDLERLKFNGTGIDADFGFDEDKVFTREELRTMSEARPEFAADVDFSGSVPVLGHAPSRPQEEEAVRAC
jgi:anaerobic magnesium-protoporphyrin IX monomethyl ester cyclase